MSTLFYFNPGCELEVVNGSPNYNLQKYPKILENDLQTLPMFFAKDGDAVLVDSKIDESFSKKFESWIHCDFLSIADINSCKKTFDKFQPWGISPRVFRLVNSVNFSSDYEDSPCSKFLDEHKMLFSRESSVSFFSDFLCSFGDGNLYPKQSEKPIIVRTLDSALEFFHSHMNGENHGCVFKAPFGASGRGVRIFRNNSLSDNILQWSEFVLKTQGCLECESLFNRISDFSMHYTINKGVAEFIGLSVFNTAENGFYKSSSVKKYSEIPGFPDLGVEKLSEQQKNILENSVYSQIYSGPLGIDCMVYEDNGKLKINPCVEINCRNSMGRFAMRLSDFVCDNSSAEFFVYQKKNPDSRFSQKPVFQDGLLKSGFLELTPTNTQIFSAGILATS